MTGDELKSLAVIFLLLISVVALPFNISSGFDEVDTRSEEKSDSSEPVDIKQKEADPTEMDHNQHSTDHSENRITHASRIPYVSREKSIDWSRSSNEDDIFSLNSIAYEGEYLSHDPIRVNSDDEFAEIAEREGWSGDGSEEAPYRIEGYEIDGNNTGYGIYVGNVTSNFVINDCYIFNAEGNGRLYFRDSGIYLYNTSNALLKDNIISSNRYAIYIQKSSNNTVANNTLFANTGPGIFLLESDDNSINYNTIRDEKDLDENQDTDHEQNSVLVKFDEPFDSLNRRYLQGELNRIAGDIDASPGRVFTFLNAGVLEVSDDMGVDTAIRILSNMPGVYYAEPNYHVELLEEPNDPGFPSLWGMKNIDVHGAWDVNNGRRDVVVAVLDTGIDYNHEDLSDNMWEDENGYHGYNFVNDSHFPMDDHNHGTHVAGTIGAVGNNGVGVVGVNWNVSLMSLKFIDESGRGSISDAVASLEYVLERKKEGVNVVATSNSWGGAGRSKLLSDAIAEHRDEDILFIAAAGNNNRNIEERPFYPASFEHTNLISVGATGRGNNRTSFSNYGPNSVHVGAPGRDINSTDIDDSYRYASGTSMAAPHVSGLAALLASEDESYTHINLKNIILSTSDRFDELENKSLTAGRINASRALNVDADPDDIHFWVHRPGHGAVREVLTESTVMVSLTDGVNPILGANVSVEFSTGEDMIYLEDHGIGLDQAVDDGYYTGSWIPEVHGEITLTFTATVDDWEGSEQVTVNVGRRTGISLWGSDLNEIENNSLLGNPYGLSLYSSMKNQIVNNNLSENNNGLYMENSNHTVISENVIKDVIDGIIVRDSSNSSFVGNEISNNIFGIDLYGEGNNTVSENHIDDTYIGILLTISHDNVISGNHISNCSYGIDLFVSTRNHINENEGYNITIFIGIWISDENIIQGNQIMDCDIGILLLNSLDCVLKENIMKETGLIISGIKSEYWRSHSIDTSNLVNGSPLRFIKNETGLQVPSNTGQLILVNSNDVIVSNLTIEKTPLAVALAFSNDNTIENNSVSENRIGVYLYRSEHNEVNSNTVYNNTINGIRILFSNDNSIKKNMLSDGIYTIYIINSERNFLENNYMKNAGLMLDGRELEHWNTHTIDTSNNIDGDPIYYWKNRTGGVIPEDAGQVILSNSSGVLVSNLNFSDLGDAISLGFSNNNTIYNTTIRNSTWAIYLTNSNDNEINNCLLINNTYGTTFLTSNRNEILDNLYHNNTYGLLLVESNKNNIINNEFSENWRGIYLILNSAYNMVYHNNFFESEYESARDNGMDNQWYKGYPEGGNYWGDHEGEDRFSGPKQNETGSDGVIDSPYQGVSFTDKYPLVDPVRPLSVRIKTPLNNTYINHDEVTVKWNSEGGIGLRDHRVRVNGEDWQEVGNKTGYTFTGLSEGNNVIELEVVDNTGQKRDADVIFSVDLTHPDIIVTQPSEGTIFYTRDVLVEWEGQDELSGIDFYEIRINDGDWIRVDELERYEFTDLKNGRHTVDVRAWDEAGNSNTVSVDFSVFVYNVYVLTSLLLSNLAVLSFGFWILFKVPKTRLEKIEPYIRKYEKKLEKDYSKYRLNK